MAEMLGLKRIVKKKRIVRKRNIKKESTMGWRRARRKNETTEQKEKSIMSAVGRLTIVG